MVWAEVHVLTHGDQRKGLVRGVIAFDVAAKTLDSFHLGVPDHSLVRPAAKARPKASLFRRFGHSEEDDLVPSGSPGRAGRTAVNTC